MRGHKSNSGHAGREVKDDLPRSVPKENKNDHNTSTETAPTRKRKDTPTRGSEASKKAVRRGRSSARAQPSQLQVMQFLLSDKSRDLCRPQDEAEAASTSASEFRSYTTVVPLTPFEELLSALILSRPIGHRLGQRSIRTLLNAPHSYRTPKAIRDAGLDKVHEALFSARTQHKAKTAEQIHAFAEVCIDQFSQTPDDASLSKLRDSVDGDVSRVREQVQKQVKGIGKTGLDIFVRRIQGVWGFCYPFVDGRTRDSLRLLGLPQDPEQLQALVNEHWAELDATTRDTDQVDERKRAVFVSLLDRAVGADLEGNVEAIMEHVGEVKSAS